MKDTPILNVDIMPIGLNGAPDLLIRELKEKGLYDPHFLHALVEGKDIEELLSNGFIKGKIIGLDNVFSDNSVLPNLKRFIPNAKHEDYLFVCEEKGLWTPIKEEIDNPLNCVGEYTFPDTNVEDLALAVYNDLGLVRALNCNFNSDLKYLNRVMRFLNPSDRLGPLVAVARFVVD